VNYLQAHSRVRGTENAIEIAALVVHRGGKTVLPGISLAVRRGMVTGLVGPSGSGKTSLLRAIVGVQVVRSGTVTVLGRPAGDARLRRRVAYMTQAPSVYGDLTVMENLRYFGRILGVSQARIQTVIDTVDLGPQAGQVVRTLSGGERSRTSLAVALLAEPEVLVLDEPTVGLDPVLRRALWGSFHELAATGTTLLVSTHVMDEAERCDDLILMRDGQVVATGATEELRVRTSTPDLESAFLELAAGTS
jgi:ABC-2 type transport system ATP-binding protein